LQNLAERRQKKIAELEQQLIAGTQTTAASPVGGDENYSAFLKQQLSEQIETVRSLEKRNRQLASELRVFKAKRQNVELLSEENISLKSQIDRLQQSLQKSGAVDLENIRMKDELNQWYSAALIIMTLIIFIGKT
jgi:cell shape-determining protein MreC